MNTPSAHHDGTQSSQHQLYKIRELLVGEQMTAQSDRISQLETRISQDFSTLRDELTQHIEAVETRLLNKISDVAHQVDVERECRESSIQTVSQEIESNTANDDERLEQFNSQMSEGLSSVTQDLHSEISHQTRSLQETIEQQIEQRITAITQTLHQEANERKVSADSERSNLANLFAELSQRLQPLQEHNDQEESAS